MLVELEDLVVEVHILLAVLVQQDRETMEDQQLDIHELVVEVRER